MMVTVSWPLPRRLVYLAREPVATVLSIWLVLAPVYQAEVEAEVGLPARLSMTVSEAPVPPPVRAPEPRSPPPPPSRATIRTIMSIRGLLPPPLRVGPAFRFPPSPPRSLPLPPPPVGRLPEPTGPVPWPSPRLWTPRELSVTTFFLPVGRFLSMILPLFPWY